MIPTIYCEICNKKLNINAYYYKNTRCVSHSKIGRKLSLAHRRKLSKLLKKAYANGRIGYWKNKRFSSGHSLKISKAIKKRMSSKKFRQKISNVCKQKGIGKWMKYKTGKNANNWQGGKRSDGYGYILLYNPSHPFSDKDKYVREHRIVIEKVIGRYLKPYEEVHHIGKTNDNRPNMLMAFISHSAHKRFEQGGIVKPEEIIFDGRKYIH